MPSNEEIDNLLEESSSTENAIIALAKLIHQEDVELGIATQSYWDTDIDYRTSMIEEARIVIEDRVNGSL